MRPSEVFEQNRQLIRDITARYRVTNPRVFGSVLHGDDKDGSDLDIVVDAPLGTTLLDLIGLEQDLEKALGVRVEITTPGSLQRFIRDEVLSEAVPI